MTTTAIDSSPAPLSLDHLPVELLECIASHLDICSLWNLLDTCTRCRYSLLASTTIWKRLEFNLDSHGLHAVYAALRRFRDSNGLGLRQRVEQVVMDQTDDSMFSPIVMFVKFPRMVHLSAKHRRFNTNLEADTKILQELIKRGSLQPHSLALASMDLYHYYMDHEPHLDAFQQTLDRLCTGNRHVQLDIRRCFSGIEESLEEQMDQLQLDHNNHQQPQQEQQPPNYCTRIISTNERCWACQALLTRCWHCVTHCTACQTKRLPPLANAHQHKQKQLEQQRQRLMAEMDPDVQDQFSLFE